MGRPSLLQPSLPPHQGGPTVDLCPLAFDHLPPVRQHPLAMAALPLQLAPPCRRRGGPAAP